MSTNLLTMLKNRKYDNFYLQLLWIGVNPGANRYR